MRHALGEVAVSGGEPKSDVRGLLEHSIGAVLHLSDLHFGRDLYGSNPIDPETLGLLQVVVPLFSEGSIYCESHAPTSVEALASVFWDMRNNPSRHYLPSVAKSRYGYPALPFDAVVVSGDIHTNNYGTRVFNSFAYTFLTSALPGMTSSGNGHIGFSLPPECLFAVPGNHDKFMAVQADGYNDSLFCTTRWAATCDYLAILRSRSGLLLAVLGIDSNFYTGSNFAMGELSDEAIAGLESELSQLDHDRGLSEAPHIRLLVLHHSPHPDDQTKKWGYFELRGHDKLVERVLPRVDVVLCGHLHEQQVHPPLNGAVIVKSGTATQKGGKNSFHTLIFCEQNQKIIMVTVPYYLSDVGRFVPRFSEAKPYPLERARPFDSSSPPSAKLPPLRRCFYSRPK